MRGSQSGAVSALTDPCAADIDAVRHNEATRTHGAMTHRVKSPPLTNDNVHLRTGVGKFTTNRLLMFQSVETYALTQVGCSLARAASRANRPASSSIRFRVATPRPLDGRTQLRRRCVDRRAASSLPGVVHRRG